MSYKICKIAWADASSVDEWKAVKDLPEEAFPCMSVGFLVKQNKNYYYLSNTHSKDDTEEEMMVACTIIIPKKWVINFEVLEDNV